MKNSLENKKYILNKILNITNKELDSYDMETDKQLYKLTENWYELESGKEHYRLLKYISTIVENFNLIDVGTYRGHSAVALSFNELNTVYSYDVLETPEIKNINKKNIIFKLQDITQDTQNIEIMNNSSFIILDVNHDGQFENYFYDFLKFIDWKGLLLLDDIHLNNEMECFWNKIKEEKYEITKIGHFTGTGLVVL
jgi:hypothetical protein